MKERTRTTVLMGVLLVVIAGYLARPAIEEWLFPPVAAVPVEAPKPLAGENKVGVPQITANKDGSYTARIDYFYRGDMGPKSTVAVRAVNDTGEQMGWPFASSAVTRGQGTVELVMERPSQPYEAHVTRRVESRLGIPMKPVASAVLDYTIDWPHSEQYRNRIELTKKTPQQLYDESVKLIDSDRREGLERARLNLEQLMLLEPRHVGARIELARYAMKTNWGPAGLAQAEKYLLTVREQEPANADGRVLLGYVYAHQGRYKEAEAELAGASEIGTPNLWLWANWGELRWLQGKNKESIEKYLKAVSGERTFGSYDRAREDAYRSLIELYEETKQIDRVDEMHRQRLAEFGKVPCYHVAYASFRLAYFSDVETATRHAKNALDDGCRDAAPVLGSAYYLAWSNSQGEERQQALNRAQALLPEGPALYFELARRDTTAKLISALVKNGGSVRVQDGEKMNALGYALSRENIPAARRLLRAGAKGTDPVGEDLMPVALIPLIGQSVPGVALMQQNGVNYAKLRYRGMTGLEIARSIGNPKLVKAIEQASSQTM